MSLITPSLQSIAQSIIYTYSRYLYPLSDTFDYHIFYTGQTLYISHHNLHTMLDLKCKNIITEYTQLQDKLYEPEVMSNIKELTRINRQLNCDQRLYDLSVQYMKSRDENKEAKQILDKETDPDMIDLAKIQLSESASKLQILEEELTQEMIPKDPNDDKDCYVELRPAAGGDEA